MFQYTELFLPYMICKATLVNVPNAVNKKTLRSPFKEISYLAYIFRTNNIDYGKHLLVTLKEELKQSRVPAIKEHPQFLSELRRNAAHLTEGKDLFLEVLNQKLWLAYRGLFFFRKQSRNFFPLQFPTGICKVIIIKERMKCKNRE